MFKFRKEIEELLPLNKKQLLNKMKSGYPVDLNKICGYEYKGVSLGLPNWVEKLTWKKFKKVFYYDLEKKIHRGWNLKIGQNQLHEEYFPLKKKNAAFGPFTLHSIDGFSSSTKNFNQYKNGILIDYSCSGKMKAMGFIRDPLISLLKDDDHQLLLGYSAIQSPFGIFNTSSFFVLEQDIPIQKIITF